LYHPFLNLWYTFINFILYNIQLSVIYIIRSHQSHTISMVWNWTLKNFQTMRFCISVIWDTISLNDLKEHEFMTFLSEMAESILLFAMNMFAVNKYMTCLVLREVIANSCVLFLSISRWCYPFSSSFTHYLQRIMISRWWLIEF